jgi:anti-sigma B factor antagonist
VKFTRTDTDTQTVLRIEGTLDALTVPEIRGCVEELVSEKRTPIVVDVSALELIDSSGVAVIVSLYKRVRGNGGALTVTGLNGQPLSIFKLLRLDRVFGS